MFGSVGSIHDDVLKAQPESDDSKVIYERLTTDLIFLG